MAWMKLLDRVRWWASAAALAGVVACASTPLEMPAPVRAPALPPPATQSMAPAPVPEAASAPAVEGAVASPVSSGGQVQSQEGMPVQSIAPYGPEVAARFPDPPVQFDTPAFAPGRQTFTSNAELGSFMHGLVRDGRPGGTSVRLIALGHSQAGEPLEGLLFTREAQFDAATLAASGRPTVMLIGQQHGDEPAGAEALLVVAEELSSGSLAGLLDRINVVMLPRANPDGARTGRRLSASGIDVNRDHLLLRTPEAQAQAQLARTYRPMVVVDSHEYAVGGRFLDKFGGVQRFDALLQYAMTPNVHEFVTKAAEQWFRQPLVAKLDAEGLTNEWYYTTSGDLSDRRVSMGSARPDNARNVNGLRNAVSFLIETRGVGIGRLHFKRRVFTQVTAIASVLSSAAEHAADLAKLRAFVENDISAHACQGEVVLEAAPTPSEYGLTMLDPVTGLERKTTVSWESTLELRPVKVRPRPCGYWLAPQESDAMLRLRALGIAVQQLDELGEMRGELYRETGREPAPVTTDRPSVADAGDVLRVQVQTVPALLDLQQGSYYVPLDQPLANLAVAALEPDTPDSFFAHRIVTSLDNESRVVSPPDVKATAVP